MKNPGGFPLFPAVQAGGGLQLARKAAKSSLSPLLLAASPSTAKAADLGGPSKLEREAVTTSAWRATADFIPCFPAEELAVGCDDNGSRAVVDGGPQLRHSPHRPSLFSRRRKQQRKGGRFPLLRAAVAVSPNGTSSSVTPLRSTSPDRLLRLMASPTVAVVVVDGGRATN
nr:hypothetical protein Iba_chr14bCG10950 [Ipomoea batatas]